MAKSTGITLCLALLAATVVGITLPNHNYRQDTNGNLLDVHDGKLYYFDGKYYFYGTAYDCGFRWRTSNYTSPFCGFKSYSSTDLLVWEDEGLLFNASTQYWQDSCANIAACFRPKVLRHPKTGEYIMWMNSGASTYSYTVFNSSSPTGPFVEIGKPVMPYARGDSSYGNGDFGIHIGPEGDGYIAYDTTPHVSGPPLFSSPNITYGVVQKLTADYKAAEPEYYVTGLANVEAMDIFYRNGWWYLTFGHICGYCDSTDTSYIKSRDPLGPYLEENRVRITDSSCGGQHTMVAQLPRKGCNSTGDPYVWLYGSDTWTGNVNEGKAGSHWEPLKFTSDGDIEPLDCYAPSYEVDVKTKPPPVSSVMQNATVASAPGNYTWECLLGVQDQNILYQFFRAPKSGNVTEFGVNVAQQANDYDLQLYFGRAISNNSADLYTPQGGVKNLWSATRPVKSVGWALPMVTATPNVPVAEGELYTIYLSSRGGSIPYCYMQRWMNASESLPSGQTETFLSEIQQGRYPLFSLPQREISFYVQIE